jgi:hypothetical protein
MAPNFLTPLLLAAAVFAGDATSSLAKAHSMIRTNPDPPTLKVGPDELFAEDVSFQTNCIQLFDDRSKRLHWILLKSVLTHSKKWGLVWRADFKINESETSNSKTNRMVCWVDVPTKEIWDVTAFGQKIAPL